MATLTTSWFTNWKINECRIKRLLFWKEAAVLSSVLLHQSLLLHPLSSTSSHLSLIPPSFPSSMNHFHVCRSTLHLSSSFSTSHLLFCLICPSSSNHSSFLPPPLLFISPSFFICLPPQSMKAEREEVPSFHPSISSLHLPLFLHPSFFHPLCICPSFLHSYISSSLSLLSLSRWFYCPPIDYFIPFLHLSVYLSIHEHLSSLSLPFAFSFSPSIPLSLLFYCISSSLHFQSNISFVPLLTFHFTPSILPSFSPLPPC